MKTKKLILLISILAIPSVSFSQLDWNLGGNNVNGTSYLGTDGSSTAPLQLKTIETGGSALPINFFTNNTLVGSFTIAGNFNLVNAPNAFLINDNPILHYRGAVGSTPSTTNIFVGVGAG